MHRSGTSAITGVLKIMGVGLGAALMEPLNENPKGYFENVTAYHINEKILQSLSSAWDDLMFPKYRSCQSETCTKFQDEIIKMVTNEFAKDDIFCIKDPRFCNLFQIWQSAFAELDIDLGCILVLRHPLEVAESLRSRDGFSFEKGVLLWMMYMLNAESYTRYLQRVVVLYDDVLKDADHFTEHVASCLNTTFPKSWLNVGQEVEQFLDRGLKHHNVKENFYDNRFFKIADNLYNLLLKLRLQGEDVDQVCTSIDLIGKEFEHAYRFFYNDDIRSHAALEDEIRKKNRQINSQAGVIRQDKIWAGKLQNKIQAAESAKTELNKKIKQQEDYVRQIQQVQLEDRKHFKYEIGQLNTSIDSMNSELNLIKGSKVWRVAELFRRLVYSRS